MTYIFKLGDMVLACHILPHPQAGPTLRMDCKAELLPKGTDNGPDVPSKWPLFIAPPEVLRGQSHIWTVVWYMRSQILKFFFFLIQEKMIPFNK